METNLTQKRRKSDTPKTSVALKRLWHKYCEKDSSLSLKEFAKSNKDAIALNEEWTLHKKGSLEKEAKNLRKKNKGPRIAIESAATKAAKRKK